MFLFLYQWFPASWQLITCMSLRTCLAIQSLPRKAKCNAVAQHILYHHSASLWASTHLELLKANMKVEGVTQPMPKTYLVPTSRCPYAIFSFLPTIWGCPHNRSLGRCCRSQTCSLFCVVPCIETGFPGKPKGQAATASAASWSSDGHRRHQGAAATQSVLFMK